MNDMFPIQPPTPGQFADELGRAYGIIPDPAWGTSEAQSNAKRKLVLRAVAETFSDKHPMGRFARDMANIESMTYPLNFTETTVSDVNDALADLEHEYQQLVAQIQEDAGIT